MLYLIWCKFCGSDVVDLIDRLKEHLIKCVDFPANLKESLDLTTSKFRKNNLQSLDQLTDQTDDEMQSTLDKVDIDRKLAKSFYSADAEYQVERQNLDKVLNNASNITLVSDDIGPSKFAGILTDNASAMRSASMNQAKQIVNFFRTHHQAESILLNQLNTITLVQPVETRWETCLDSIQSIRRCKLGLQMSVVQPEITPLLSYIYEEWRQIRESVNAQVLDLNFKMKVHRLIDNRFEFVFHPAMAIANLLDPNFHGKSLGPTDFETIIISYIEKVYTFEEAAHIYGVMQKYIAKTDEFSGALLRASIEYSSPISWWKSNFTHKFPVVVELACRVLSIPTSSAAAERNWSNFGFIHSKLRARLNNNRVKKLVAIYQNLRIHKEIKEDNWFEEDEV
ncbi:zinc finger BED domain-containing protein 1-like [Rhizophagus clarus]|uniref:Zinc finger BED domain-containing protein 1-like n=1 Tax=Rhizophagus clarus TaxID=94130 RepID=A0A8H3MB24_9GLOM|nr:zinc finger BED domain-containing protein 1-like [Rhizophagus clarus]